MKETFALLVVAAIGVGIGVLVGALPAMFLWNWLMPALFGLKTISFLQALGLCLLCSILFKSSSTSSKS